MSSLSSYTFPKKTVRDISLKGKRVLVRADFNVPLDERGEIDSDFRILQTLPTIKYLQEKGAAVILLAHLGRPDGKPSDAASLKPVALRLEELLNAKVTFVPDCIGDSVRQALKGIKPGSVTLLENVRFHPGEEKNEPGFAGQLIEFSSPDYVVQDGFGVVHRAHASTEGISHLKPALAGLLLEREVSLLNRAITQPQKPLVAIMGGAKISDKLPLIERFLDQADTILVGGAIANTFLKCSGYHIGKSLYEKDEEVVVEKIVAKAKKGQLVLPVDVAVAKGIEAHAARLECKPDHVHGDEYILDIGSVTAQLFTHYIETAGTVIWNGTMGYAENPRFAKGSALIAQAISAQGESLTSIIGGGDTADFVLGWQAQNKQAVFTHISTGGGASLELLSGEKLPGVEALLDK